MVRQNKNVARLPRVALMCLKWKWCMVGKGFTGRLITTLHSMKQCQFTGTILKRLSKILFNYQWCMVGKGFTGRLITTLHSMKQCQFTGTILKRLSKILFNYQMIVIVNRCYWRYHVQPELTFHGTWANFIWTLTNYYLQFGVTIILPL